MAIDGDEYKVFREQVEQSEKNQKSLNLALGCPTMPFKRFYDVALASYDAFLPGTAKRH